MLACLLVAVSLLFLGWGLTGRVWLILEMRSVKLAGLILVGFSVGVATVMFQTISGNRILTPAIMGFDALFLLLQTSLVFTLGGFGYAQLPGTMKFMMNMLVMMGAAMLLFGLLLSRNRHDIQLMILVGVICGLLFRSLTSFFQRMIDPSEFAMVQGAMFASFGAIDTTQLIISSAVFAVVAVVVWRNLAKLDVVSLGRSTAISLGLPYDRIQMGVLVMVAALVSVSTALVGPITFLGLLVASLAHILMKTHRHVLLLPAAALISATVLVAGQTVFERMFRMQSTLAVVIEFFGGLLFLYLVANGRVR